MVYSAEYGKMVYVSSFPLLAKAEILTFLPANYLTFDIMSRIIFGESFDLIGSPKNREIVKCIEDSNVRTGVLSQAGELSTRRLDRWLFPQAIQGRNAFIRFVNILLKKRMSAKPLKRHDAFSFLLDAVDPETQQGFTPAEIGAESTTMIVAGKIFFHLPHFFLFLCLTLPRIRHILHRHRFDLLLPLPQPGMVRKSQGGSSRRIPGSRRRRPRARPKQLRDLARMYRRESAYVSTRQ